MKRILLFSICFLFNFYFSQTNVGGAYFQDVNWDISGSPYNLTSDVQIPSGYTLTINPGVVVNYSGDYEILVKGALKMLGTSTNHIIINGNYTSGSPNFPAIIFKSTNLGNSQIYYSDFSGNKRGIQLADESEFIQDAIKNSGTLSVDNCNFQNSGIFTKGYNTGAILNINNTTFNSSTIKGFYPRTEIINLYSSTIISSSVTSESYNNGINLYDSNSSSTNFVIGCCSAAINFFNSNLQNCSLIEGSGSPVNGPLSINSSLFKNTKINLPKAKINIKNSYFDNTVNNTNYIGYGTIECSVFNGANNGTALSISGYNGYDNGYTTNITNSYFKNLNTGISLLNNAKLIVNNTNFENNSLYNIENKTTNLIDAKNNYWFTNDINTIKTKIYDYYNNINFGIVDYSNYLSSAIDLNSCNIFMGSKDISKVEDNIKVMPNPSKGAFRLYLDNFKNVDINILDASGRQVLHESKINGNYYNFYLGKVGFYLLEIKSNNYRKVVKLIVE